MSDLVEYSRKPTEKEIRFGYGDRVYARRKKREVLNRNGKPKKRMKADGHWWSYCGPVL